MRRIILIYGALSGTVVIASMIFGLTLGGAGSVAAMEWVGYLIMLVALSVIFVGIKRYRDQHLGGVIRFGTALLVGLGISAVAGVVYVAAWEVNLAATDHAFIEDYTASVIEKKRASGATTEEMDEVGRDMEQMKQR